MENRNNLIASVIDNLHIDELNDMQKAALSADVEGKDIILLSPTGSGKTLAYLLPLLKSIDATAKTVQVLILAPSRELAIQINSVFKSLKIYKSCCCYGGHSFTEEKNYIINNHPPVIIGTPGRITDHLSKGIISPQFIHTLIIDEFDKSLELGFQEEMEDIISQLSGLKKRILVSATDMEEVPPFTGMVNPVKLNFLSDNEEARIQSFKVMSPAKDKIDTLYNLLCVLGNESGIVFCNHRESVERVHKILKEKGIACEKYHGGMEQEDRERALYKYNNGSSFVLISTDLASRGLDISDIQNIIHYHLPINEETYIHRNGRTARWNKSGSSFMLLNETESLPDYIKAENIKEYILPVNIPKPPKPKWATLYIGKGKKSKISKIDIVGFLYKKGNLSKEEIVRVEVREHYSLATISSGKLKQTLALVQQEKIKGIKVIIEEAKY